MLGIVSAGIVAYYIMKRDGRGWHTHIFDFTLCCGLFGIVGGRLWDVFFFDWPYYHNHLAEIPFVWQGGMAIQGGLLFGALAGIWYTRCHHIDTWAFGDLLAPAIILGQSVGRMANLMNGDAFGHPTGGSFGILYPDTTLAYHTYGNQPLWPAEIWEGQLGIFAVRHAVCCRTLLLGISARRLYQHYAGLKISPNDERHCLCHRPGRLFISPLARLCRYIRQRTAGYTAC